MTVSTRCGLCLVIAGTFAVSAVTPRAAYSAPQADIARFKTYAWVSAGAKLTDQTTVAVQQALDAQLAAKGLTKTERPEVVLAYQVDVQPERLSVVQGSSMGMDGRGGVRTAVTTSPRTITVKLYVYEAATNQLVWEGAATKSLDEHSNPEKRRRTIGKTVAKLLKNFPSRN